MPFYKEIKNQNFHVLLWKFFDTDVLDFDQLIAVEDRKKIENYHRKKITEYLMVRQLKSMPFPNHKILYKKNGKPYLEPQDAYISVSHSYPFAGFAFGKNRVGLDLEKVQPKIEKIQHKFLHPSEYDWIEDEYRMEYLTIIWAIKEALYKLHPSNYWSLKKHYQVSPFRLDNLDEISCRVFDDEFEDCYIAKVLKIEAYYLAMIEETHQINYQFPLEDHH